MLLTTFYIAMNLLPFQRLNMTYPDKRSLLNFAAAIISTHLLCQNSSVEISYLKGKDNDQ